MVQYLESLANELLLDIFEYISAVHLLQSFSNLNHRLNNLIFIHFEKFSLDFRYVSKNDLHSICEKYLHSKLTKHIKSLCLSNNDDTPEEINIFDQYNFNLNQFEYLQSFSLYDLCSNELMNKILFQLKYLKYLTHLTIAGCYLQMNQIETQELIDNIWSLSKLIYCYLNIHFGESNIFIPTIQSLSLKYLFIWGIEHNIIEMNSLFKQTPNLEHFSILLNDDDDDNDQQEERISSSIIKLNLYLSRIEENILIKFFQNMQNLTHLIIDLSSTTHEIFDGYQWEDFIRNYLPNLKIFQFRIEFQLNGNEQEIDNLFNSFNTSFWIEEHRWFICCHWNLSKNFIYIYTLPYCFKDFHLNSLIEFKSTCSNENKYLDYNHVNDLTYKNLISSPIRFLNIKTLSVNFPINENFRLILPKLDQITSLDVSINENDYNQLQNLLDSMPYLYSLSFNLCTSFLPIYKLQNSSIRRLDLRGYEQYFNDEQCNLLSHSLLGNQCEILFVKIQNRHILIDLIKNMIHLRTLNIQCENDKFNCIEQDELIIWLKYYLPSTCIISRDLVFRNDIRIWIR